ncbi:hypothetical protein DFP73DRAFT_532038 [Morchella snyderi]|nr:hypothetical protein DFP73DRAFT_532038 [Morchella snyderi]
MVVISFSGALKACILLASLHSAVAAAMNKNCLHTPLPCPAYPHVLDLKLTFKSYRGTQQQGRHSQHHPQKQSREMVFDMARPPVKASSNNGLGDLYQDSEGPHYGGCDKDFHRHEGDTTATTDVTVINDATDRVVGTGTDLGYVTDIAATTVTSVVGSSTITSIAATETIVTVVWESTVVVTATVTDPTTVTLTSTILFTPTLGPRPASAKQRRSYRRRIPDCLEHSSHDRISECCSSVFRGPKAGHIITKAIATTTITSTRSKTHTSFGGHVVVPKETVTVTSTATAQPTNGITATLTTVLTTTATLSSTTSIIAPSTVLATALSTSTTLLPAIITITITITITSTSTPTTTVTVTSTRCPAAPTPHHRHRRRANA